MLKILIIIFLCVFAMIDILAILWPRIKKYLETKEKVKKRRVFGEKMKKLEIK